MVLEMKVLGKRNESDARTLVRRRERGRERGREKGRERKVCVYAVESVDGN